MESICKYCRKEIYLAGGFKDNVWFVLKDEDRYDDWAVALCKGREFSLNTWKNIHEPEDRIITLVKTYLKNHPEDSPH